jgi:hypothetical protein
VGVVVVSRLVVALGALAALAGLLAAAHSLGVKAGRAEVQARWDLASAEARARAAERVDKAEAGYVQEVEVVKTVYRDRIKEVKVYVPTAGSCPADDDFVRLFNAAR